MNVIFIKSGSRKQNIPHLNFSNFFLFMYKNNKELCGPYYIQMVLYLTIKSMDFSIAYLMMNFSLYLNYQENSSDFIKLHFCPLSLSNELRNFINL